MYELIIKILGEKDYKKYTIEEIEEIKSILEQFKETEEIRLRRLEDGRSRTTKTNIKL